MSNQGSPEPKDYPWWARALGWVLSKLLGGKDG